VLEWYIIAVVGFALGFDQHRTILLSNHPYPTHPYGPVLFDTAAWLGGIATLAMLIGGFFFGVWWWPVMAMIIGTGTNYVGRKVMPMEHRWIGSIGGTGLGFISTFILFNTL